MEHHLSGPHLFGLFTYPDTCLGTNPHSSTESALPIRKFSYLDSQFGNGGVRISEARLYMKYFDASQKDTIKYIGCFKQKGNSMRHSQILQ